MSSSIKLTNSSGKIVTITNPDTTSADVAVDLLNNAYTIATVDDFGTVPVGYTTVIVKDTDRGGIFVWSASGAANGGTIFDGTTGYSWERQYSGAVNVKWFGAKGDGITDDTVAIQSAIFYSLIYFPSGEYNLKEYPIFESLTNKTIFGDGDSSILTWENSEFAIKSPSFVTFKDLLFFPKQADSIQKTIWVSNFTSIKFLNCTFRGFGADNNINLAGSVCLMLYAGDNDSSLVSSGDSDDATIDNCNFYGYRRKTNFGIRVYTEFSGSVSTLTNVKIVNTNFGGFNWNAVEIAGMQTSLVSVDNCTGNMNGLCPFEIDKGAHHCTITNIKINRLLGNIDKDVNPNTRIAIAGIQGVLPTTGYSHNNIVDGITAVLLKSDIDVFNSYDTSGVTCASMSYVYDSEIKNIKVTIDGIPNRHTSSVVGMCLVGYETCSGAVFENIKCDNAREGIIQTSVNSSGMTYNKTNIVRDIENTGILKGEILQASFGASTYAKTWLSIQNCILKTDLSDTYIVPTSGNKYAINVQASGSSLQFVHIKDSYFTIPYTSTSWFCLHQINNLALDNLQVAGVTQNDRFIHSEGSTTPTRLYLNNIMGSQYGNLPLYMNIVLQNINQTCGIYGTMNIYTVQPESYNTTLIATDTPSYPPIVHWSPYLKIEKESKTAGGYMGWVKIGASWKGYGLIQS